FLCSRIVISSHVNLTHAPTAEIYPLSLHDALPISRQGVDPAATKTFPAGLALIAGGEAPFVECQVQSALVAETHQHLRQQRRDAVTPPAEDRRPLSEYPLKRRQPMAELIEYGFNRQQWQFALAAFTTYQRHTLGFQGRLQG